MAEYVQLALGDDVLDQIIGPDNMAAVKSAVSQSLPFDASVTKALRTLTHVLECLQTQRRMPQDFFESPSPALSGQSPRHYLCNSLLVTAQGRKMLMSALNSYISPGTSAAEESAERRTGAASVPTPVQAPVQARIETGEQTAAPEEPSDGTSTETPEDERYSGHWEEAIAQSVTLDRSVRWTAHYVHLALGHVLLTEILGLYPALTVVKVADGSKLPDRPVAQALDALVRVVDGLKERGARPEDFFECPSPALLGRSPRAYLSAYPLTKPEARLALSDALKEFPHSHEGADPGEPAASAPLADTDAEPSGGEPAALREAQAAADEAARRLRELEADVADRIARARAAERNSARAQAQAEAHEAAQRIHALQAGVAEQVASARAEERNRARAETQAELSRQVAQARSEAERLVRAAEAAAEEHVLQATSSMAGAAAEREERALRRMEEEFARRSHDVEEAAHQQVQVLEARLVQAEAALAERVHAAQVMKHEATERVRAVERWAELRIAEVQQAARSRITALEAQLAPPPYDATPNATPNPAPAPSVAHESDPRRWWRRP